MKLKHQGFTLIELAVVLAVLGIVMAGALSGVGAMRESAKFKQDQQNLDDIKSALISFAAVNGYVPCPYDGTDNLGTESRTGADEQCASVSGQLPYAILGTRPLNAYGHPFSYHVNRDTTDASKIDQASESASYFGINCGDGPPCFDADTPPTADGSGSGNYDIKDDADNPLAVDVPVVIISHGQNPCASTPDAGGNEPDAGGTDYEFKNCHHNASTYYQATQDRSRFDDVLIWVSSLEIKQFTVFADSGNKKEPPPSYSPSQDLAESGLLADATVYGELNNQETQTVSGTSAIIGQLNSEASVTVTDSAVVAAGALNADATMVLSNGNNIVEVDSMNTNARIYEADGSNGHNRIRVVNDMNSNAEISVNNGDNKIYVGGSMYGSAVIRVGTGTNVVFVMGDIWSSVGIVASNGGTLYVNQKLYDEYQTRSSIITLNGATLELCTDANMNCP